MNTKIHRKISPRTYVDWLIFTTGVKRQYLLDLARYLHNLEFRWSVPNDDNRLEDGRNLRNLYIDNNELRLSRSETNRLMKDNVSVLEVLIGIAIRLNDTTSKDGSTDRVSYWFEQLIDNLGLLSSGGSLKEGGVHLDRVNRIVETFVNREYDYYGNGGLFPMKFKPKRDMRQIELWYQMMLWLNERQIDDY